MGPPIETIHKWDHAVEVYTVIMENITLSYIQLAFKDQLLGHLIVLHRPRVLDCHERHMHDIIVATLSQLIQ